MYWLSNSKFLTEICTIIIIIIIMYMPAVNILFLSPLENVDFSLNLHIDNNYYSYVNGSGIVMGTNVCSDTCKLIQNLIINV